MACDRSSSAELLNAALDIVAWSMELKMELTNWLPVWCEEEQPSSGIIICMEVSCVGRRKSSISMRQEKWQNSAQRVGAVELERNRFNQ